jgi:type IX secretion system PorP/SprF family membrane protein
MMMKMNFRTITYFIAFCLLAIKAVAQQAPIFSEYNYNKVLVNQAFAGLTDEAEITLSANSFMNNIEGSPQSAALTFHTPVGRYNMGLGIGTSYETIGVTNIGHLYGVYTYHINFDHKGSRPDWEDFQINVLSFGISAGVDYIQENLLDLNASEDPHFDENINQIRPTLGAGVLYNRKQFYLGFSSPNLLENIKLNNENVRFNNLYNAYFGYRIFTDRYEKYAFQPGFLIKYVKGAPLQADVNMLFEYKNKIDVGVGYRTTQSMNFIAGLRINDTFKIVYSYNHDFSQSPLENAHGVVLKLKF